MLLNHPLTRPRHIYTLSLPLPGSRVSAGLVISTPATLRSSLAGDVLSHRAPFSSAAATTTTTTTTTTTLPHAAVDTCWRWQLPYAARVVLHAWANALFPHALTAHADTVLTALATPSHAAAGREITSHTAYLRRCLERRLPEPTRRLSSSCSRK
jgi:hypothetical protein